ncbi:DMT family transporter [Streptomyces sp. NPDC057298]|uniref:DMT family transporter n=1 Tax=Streptomyces sp. NPDC057298 TaxID=3346091 RepID=UPI00363A2EAA
MNEPVYRQQIGYDLAGNPMYAPPAPYGPAPVAQQATQPLQPIKAHPWGAYLAGGCLGLLALTVAVVLVAFLVFGFAILAAVLGLVVVALTISLLVLRGMVRDHQKGR